MSIVVNFPFGLSELDKIFEVTDFLQNREALIKEFQPEVSKYLVKDEFFKGVARRRYQEMFDELIISLIRQQLVKHFPSYTPEEIILLTDVDFLKIVTDDFYFDKSNYSKERNIKNEQSKH